MRKAVFATVFVCVCAILMAQSARAEKMETKELTPQTRLEEIWQLALANYIKPIEDTPEAKQQCLNEMMRGGLGGCLGDHYARYYSRGEVRALVSDVAGETGGIGVGLKRRGNYVRIVNVLPNSSALRSGLAVGDAILKVDGVNVTNYTAEAIAGMIIGEPGTVVRLHIKRIWEELPMITMARKTMVIPSVEERTIGDVEVLKISYFRQNTPRFFEGAVEKAVGRGIGKFIIDLRDNPGGWMEAVEEMACLFSNDHRDVIATTFGRNPSDMGTDSVRGCPRYGRGKFKGLRFVILVDQDSASGAELFAALAKDWGFAKVIGVRTYGKGSTQPFFELSDGSVIKFTTTQFYVGNNFVEVDGVGVAPDLEVPRLNEKGEDAQMAVALEALK